MGWGGGSPDLYVGGIVTARFIEKFYSCKNPNEQVRFRAGQHGDDDASKSSSAVVSVGVVMVHGGGVVGV